MLGILCVVNDNKLDQEHIQRLVRAALISHMGSADCKLGGGH